MEQKKEVVDNDDTPVKIQNVSNQVGSIHRKHVCKVPEEIK